MLLDAPTLAGIAAGDIDLAFRRWRRPTVKAGGRLRTRLGELAIVAVDLVDPAHITDSEARRAGYASADDVRVALDRRSEGDVYRVAVRVGGPDPRVALRDAVPETADIKALWSRLDRMGAWTEPTLLLIAERPGTRAEDLAALLGREKHPFKASVRRLKELGLTESLEVGYRLSPRGRALMQWRQQTRS